MQYDHKKVEAKWAQKWVDNKTFTPDLDKAENPYYALFMFPYPSAEGLHIGNFYAFSSVDIIAKYKKIRGYDIFEPIGFDSFGMHSENYALKIGERPRTMLDRTEKKFREQIIASGLSCDWTREVNTTDPAYYKWTQWIFTQLFKKGLAFQEKSLLNWCPKCKTVLADEQIEGGVCERCKAIPEKKSLKQWFFKITRYSQRLLDGLGKMDWSEITKAAQKNWVGKSEGAEVKFIIKEEEVVVFTTRPDTLFGATYFVLSPEHSLANKISLNNPEVKDYIKKSAAKSDLERTESKDKTGVFANVYAVNPINNKKIPVWIADYVLMQYGTGAIMAVPAHDERDYKFAQKYDLPILEVLKGGDVTKEAFTEDGIHINSEFLDGLGKEESIEKTIEWLEKNNKGQRKTNYKLRDWCISRQRYWGPPIPIIHCDKCGAVPVPEEDLPVLLPDLKENWQPAGDGKGPLAKSDEFINTKCPKCGEKAKREADVMDNFLDSAWYFFRYLSPNNNENIFNEERKEKWLPVDIYIGGNEHAVLHLMYTRFITMFLHDLGLVDFDNPFKKFRANGMILKDGKKMSKSKGNVINPEDYGKKIGYDALKSYLLFLGPLEEDRSFSDSGVLGTKRWIDKIFTLQEKVEKEYKDKKEVVLKINESIKKVEKDIESQKYNTAIACLMKTTNFLSDQEKISQDVWLKFVVIIAPFTPYLSEEMWEKAGYQESIFKEKRWPAVDENIIKEKKINFIIQINGKVRDTVKIEKGINQEEIEKNVLDREKIKNWIKEKKIEKTIFIPDKLINFVVK